MQADIPTMIGVGPGEDAPMEMEDSETPIKPSPSNKYYIDNTMIGRPREGVEMKSPLKDGLSKRKEGESGEGKKDFYYSYILQNWHVHIHVCMYFVHVCVSFLIYNFT